MSPLFFFLSFVALFSAVAVGGGAAYYFYRAAQQTALEEDNNEDKRRCSQEDEELHGLDDNFGNARKLSKHKHPNTQRNKEKKQTVRLPNPYILRLVNVDVEHLLFENGVICDHTNRLKGQDWSCPGFVDGWQLGMSSCLGHCAFVVDG